jgi:hypothetical protein
MHIRVAAPIAREAPAEPRSHFNGFEVDDGVQIRKQRQKAEAESRKQKAEGRKKQPEKKSQNSRVYRFIELKAGVLAKLETVLVSKILPSRLAGAEAARGATTTDER